MKIVMIGPFALFPKGTVSLRMLHLANWLSNSGKNTIHIILPPYDNPTQSGKLYRFNNINVFNVVIPKLPTPLKEFLVALKLVRLALSFKPQVIHIFKPIGYSGLAAMILMLYRKLKRVKLPIIVDLDDWEGRGGFYDLWYRQGYPLYFLRLILFQLAIVPHHADFVTVASRALETLMWANGVPQEKVLYLPNGPFLLRIRGVTDEYEDLDILKKIKKISNFNNPKILFYTRFFEANIKKVIIIFKMLKKNLKNVKFLIVGKGSYNEEKTFFKIAEKRGLTKDMIYFGWVPPKFLPLIFERSDLAIYPFDDNLLNRTKCPGKLIELMNAGVPIVAEKVGQTIEYIEHEKSGILVSPNNINSFVRYVIKILKDPALRVKLSKNARLRIKKAFGWKKLASETEKIYKKLIKE